MHTTAAERQAMASAFELAQHGPRGVNPQVGAVLLAADGSVLAEGWHRGAGSPHAEADALSKLSPGQARGATAVVTLEPCSHTGRTGPCAEALIAAGVSRVVYAAEDPGSVSGGGAAGLRAAGIDVVRASEPEGEALIADWRFVQQHGRPRVTVKWAQSLDARTAAQDGTSQWITGAQAREHVHTQRAAHDAIAVGTGTVLADDPQLTARIDGAPQPVPVVIGTREIPADARIRQHPQPLLTYATVAAAMSDLAARGLQSLYIEGGPSLASSFIREGLADTLHVYIAPTLLGGSHTATADLGVQTIDQQRRLDISGITRLGDDILIVATPQRKDT